MAVSNNHAESPQSNGEDKDNPAIDTKVLAASSATSNYVYIESTDFGWVPARVLELLPEDNVKVSVPQYRTEAAIQSDGGQKATHSETHTIQLKDYPNHSLPLQNVDEETGALNVVEDMVDLPFLHEAAILYNLKARHVLGKPYTRTGDIVIACNPYQWIHALYSTTTRRHYANALVWKATGSAGLASTNLSSLEPHIYEVSAAAYRGLAMEGYDQSILVSGESGAGKTESVKICLHHIASVQQGTAGQEDITSSTTSTTNTTSTSSTSPIVQRVLDSNPLLEAFGNAQTIRNDNSSRFGKYIQLQFDVEDPVDAVYAGHSLPSCVLAGSKCEVYLLEKSRVVEHEPEERTYHIFYQLLASDNEVKQEIWKGLVDCDQESFNYVGYAELDTIEGVSDADRFQKTDESLELIGVAGEKRRTLFRAICIVLQLGNLMFEPHPEDEDSRSEITSREELSELAQLMNVDAQVLESAFLIRTMVTRGETFKVPLSATKAKDSCDAFAKEIYAKAFLWLVRAINDATAAEHNYTSSSTRRKATEVPFGTIGLLDIFGFESFETNRFEQLCINYTNEKLQQKFTQDIFRSVQNEYEAEGIELGEIKYDDNTDVLDLVEGRMGLLAVLNEECVRPGGNDKAFVLKIAEHHKTTACLFRNKRYTAFEFGIKHYAGEVVYNATGFVHKNMDTLPSDLQEAAKQSSNEILAKHMSNNTMINAPNTGAGSAPKPKKKPPQKGAGANPKELAKKGSALVGQTVWTKFKGQLTALMLNLGKTRTRYIRCIKPNVMKQPLVMQHLSTVEQLRCAGVVAAVTISRSAFPNRLEHKVVLDRFKALWDSRAHQVEARAAAEETTNDPTGQLKHMAENLLTEAMKELETKNDTGATVRAFVMGNTRTYFRAGSLEFLEAERLKRLGFWAADIQRVVRGFCKNRVFQRLRRASTVLQSLLRQKMATRSYQTQRRAAIQIECWDRCVFAKLLLIKLRRNYRATCIQKEFRRMVLRTRFLEERKAAVVIEAMLRGALQRPKYRSALHQFKEDAKLENQVLALQRKLEEAENRRLAAEQMADEKARKAVEAYEEKKEIEAKQQEQEQERQRLPPTTPKKEKPEPPIPLDTPQAAARAAAAGAANAAAAEPDTPTRSAAEQQRLNQQQQTLIDESGKMLEHLQKEILKLRRQNVQMKKDYNLLKDNNDRLMGANASAGASFAALNQHARTLTKTNEKLTEDIEKLRQNSQMSVVVQAELREELKMKQATYVAEIHSRVQYQRALEKVAKLVESRCRDTRLVEAVLSVVDECEANFEADSATMGAFSSMFTSAPSAPSATSTSTPSKSDSSGEAPANAVADAGESTLMSSIRSFWS